MSAAEKRVHVPFDVVASDDDRAAWLSARRRAIGASETPAIFGVSPWSSALQVWADKTERAPSPDIGDVEHVFWGRMLEPGIVRGYAERTGRAAVHFGLTLRSRAWPWMSCTPDALCTEGLSYAAHAMEDDVATLREMSGGFAFEAAAERVGHAIASGAWWPLQTKNIGFGSAKHWEDGVPVYYRLQCVHEALVCGAQRVTGAALVAGQRLMWEDIEVAPDGSGLTERQIIKRTGDFWRDYVQTGVEPPADASESARQALLRLYPEAEEGSAVSLGIDWQERGYELDALKEKAAQIDGAIAAEENLLRQAIGGHERAHFPDGSGYTLKTQTRNGKSYRVLRRVLAKG